MAQVPKTPSDKQRDEQRLSQLQLQNDFKELLQSLHGRRILWWLLGECHIYSANMSGNSSVYATEGVKSVGLKVLNQINDADPRAYPKMMLESVDRNQLLSEQNGDAPKHVSSVTQ